MNERRCGNCAGWSNGECHLSPPTPILFGIKQAPQSVLTKQPVAPPQPVFMFVRPAVGADEFCLMHMPLPA